MNEFEKSISTENYTGETSQEMVIEWIKNDKVATCTFANGTKQKNQVMKLAETDPEEVQICTVNKDGSIVAHFPSKWINVRRPRQMSDTTREKMIANLEKGRQISKGISQPATEEDEYQN